MTSLWSPQRDHVALDEYPRQVEVFAQHATRSDLMSRYENTAAAFARFL
jgi:hypothetical protein